jgi:mannose-6-phosphate isomerase-like protein (cupin superfamily)
MALLLDGRDRRPRAPSNSAFEARVSADRLLHPTSEMASYGAVELLTIARGFATCARWWPGMARPTQRTWDLMAVSDWFEAWVIAWPPGGGIELHDHGRSAGAVVVASGKLAETTVAERTDGSFVTVSRILSAGSSVTFASHHVHDIVNLGTVPAISVHVYAPRLTNMTYYEISGGRLNVSRTVGGANP